MGRSLHLVERIVCVRLGVCRRRAVTRKGHLGDVAALVVSRIRVDLLTARGSLRDRLPDSAEAIESTLSPKVTRCAGARRRNLGVLSVRISTQVGAGPAKCILLEGSERPIGSQGSTEVVVSMGRNLIVDVVNL